MLNESEILNLIRIGEGFNVEFKINVPAKVKELTEEICAFANAAGGILLIGVDDRGRLVGVQIDNTKRSAIQNSLNEINPAIKIQFYQVLSSEQKAIVGIR